MFVLPFLNLAAARGGPGDAALPVAAAAAGPGRRPRGRAPRRDVPLAERRDRPRGVADAAPQPAVGALAAGQLRACSGTSGSRSPTTPGGTTRRPATSTSSTEYGAETDPGDRRVLRRPGRLRPAATTASTSAASWAPTSTTTRCPDASDPGLDDNAYTNVMAAWALAPRRSTASTSCPPRRRQELLDALGITPGRPGAVGAREPQAAAVLARRRRPQPVPRLRAAGGVRLGRLPPALRRHQPARPHPRGRGRLAPTATSCPSRPTS